MAFTATPTDGSVTPIPMSSVVPDGTNTPLAVEGGPSLATGGNTLAPVSMYVKDGNDIAQGTSTDAANANSVIGQLKQLKTNTTLGQATMAASLPVTMASNQGNINVAINAAIPTGANTIGAVTQASGPWTSNITQVGGTNVVTAGVAGLLAVGGPVASGASNADNPVKMGAVFNTTQPTVTNGQVVDIQATSRGAKIVATGVDAFTVQPGNTANTTPWLVAHQATTAGGSTPSHTMSAASTNATSLKASAGLLYGFCISNVNAAARFVKFYNKASAPTVGTDTPVTTIQIPANGTVIRAYPVGMTFSTGIAWAATGLMTNADTTAIAANDLSIDIDYL